MKYTVSENSKIVLDYLKENVGENMTAEDIGKALGLETKSVNGIVTSGLQRKGYAERIPANVELEDGTLKTIKFIRATEAGLAYDDEEARKKDAEAAVAKAE